MASRNQAEPAGTRDLPEGTPVACPKCSGAKARKVRLGVYCWTCGLVNDGSEELFAPERDPISVAIATDPEVVEAREAAEAARVAYDSATEAWKSAVGGLAMIRIKARADEGEFRPDGGWRPSKATRDLARREKQLAESVPALDKARERAGEDLRTARAHAQRVYAVVGRRHGIPLDIPAVPGESSARLSTVISTYNL